MITELTCTVGVRRGVMVVGMVTFRSQIAWNQELNCKLFCLSKANP